MVSSSPALLMIIKITWSLQTPTTITTFTAGHHHPNHVRFQFLRKLNLNEVRHIRHPTWTAHFEFRTFTILHASVFFLYFIVSENKRMKYFLLKAYCQTKLVGLKCPTKMTVPDFSNRIVFRDIFSSFVGFPWWEQLYHRTVHRIHHEKQVSGLGGQLELRIVFAWHRMLSLS